MKLTFQIGHLCTVLERHESLHPTFIHEAEEQAHGSRQSVLDKRGLWRKVPYFIIMSFFRFNIWVLMSLELHFSDLKLQITCIEIVLKDNMLTACSHH